MKKILITLLALLPIFIATAQTAAELTAINTLRTNYSKAMYRPQDLVADSLSICLAQLQSNGQFADFVAEEATLTTSNAFKTTSYTAAYNAGTFLYNCFNRIWRIAENYRGKAIPDSIRIKLFQSIVYYGNLETGRPDGDFRFHRSCFAIPSSAVNTYFCLLSTMNLIENGTTKDALSVSALAKLKALGTQCWTKPVRNDSTDKNVISTNRFRGHVWWVGGNALAYRPLLPVAAMLKSAPMISVISQVSLGGLSNVSQNTYNTAFWTEGFTTDGAGWGHGTQCLVWGYPSDGALTALDLLTSLSSTPWVQKLNRENVDACLNYIRNSAFYYHNGYVPPLFERTNSRAVVSAAAIKSVGIASKLLAAFSSSLTAAEIAELKLFVTQGNAKSIVMAGYPSGDYNGSRYFFNNDDMIKKNKNYYVFVNMASSRCFGLESDIAQANGFNLYTCDGTTLYQRTGDEYVDAYGALNQSALPGITARQIGNASLVGITLWGGFNSKHNFAAGATSFGNNYSCGFIYEKQDAPATANNTAPSTKNPGIYGVKAYKSYFMLGDLMVAMGAGITNLNTALAGNIVTSVEQNLRKADLAVNSVPVTAATYTEILKATTDNTVATKWVLNNGFAFGVITSLTTGEVKLVAETRNTIWKKLAPVNNAAVTESTLPMMQLQIDHGLSVTNGTYVYLVSNTGVIPTSLPKIISNTTSLQAAAAADSSVIGGVFYTIANGINFGKYNYKLSSPAALLIENYTSDSLTITVTDATMDSTLNSITLTTTLPIAGTNVTKVGSNYSVSIPMPKGDLCGSPAIIKVKRVKSTSTAINELSTDDKLHPFVNGHVVSFNNRVDSLSVFSIQGVEVLRLHDVDRFELSKNGVYIIVADKVYSKIVIGK